MNERIEQKRKKRREENDDQMVRMEDELLLPRWVLCVQLWSGMF